MRSLTKIPAENEFKTPMEMSSAAPLWEKTVRTPIPIPIPLIISLRRPNLNLAYRGVMSWRQ